MNVSDCLDYLDGDIDGDEDDGDESIPRRVDWRRSKRIIRDETQQDGTIRAGTRK